MAPDLPWLIIVAFAGIVAGSLVTFMARGSLFRNIVIGAILALGLALLLNAMNITLPFEPALRNWANSSANAIESYFSHMARG